MSQDYYSPHPTLRLGEPLLLGGQVGSGVAAIARAMTARTGLPFSEVDRMVENSAGQSLARLLEARGLARLAEECLVALQRALSRRPCGIVVLGSGALRPGDLLPFLGLARFVYVERPADVLLRRIRGQLEKTPGSLFQFQLAVPETAAELGPILTAQEPALRSAHITVQAEDQHPNQVASQLLGSLDRIMEVNR